MFLEITVDAPAKSLWLQIKQFNGYWGCSTCKEKGSQLVIGKGKKDRLSTLNINHHDLFPRVVSFQSLGGGGSFQQEGAIMEKRTTCKVPSYLPVIK